MKNIHVIQHTHWDFEWYFTRNEALVQFVYHMDEVFNALQKQTVDYYLLDGQMSILDDYLDAYPEKRAELSKWVQAGRLFIGPWYTQTDEMIITGESIIRNLSLGMEMADELGGSQRIGYLPDSFGQAADMPKIYNGMGINNALFWRGLSKDKTKHREFVWDSEDGSKVTTLNIKDGYFVGVGLIEDDDPDNLMKTIVDGATLNDLALPVGGDQRYVDYNLKDRIDFYNRALENTDYQLTESNYPALFKKIDAQEDQLAHVEGEFLSSSVSKIHRSIYSSRYDQKYLNDKVERRLIYQLEPLMVMADRAGIPYKKSLLKKIWKLIVRNHAHDSAGGCNSDATNQIVLERLREADQLSYSTVDYLTRKLAESQANVQLNDLTFFNTLPFPIKKTVKFSISLTEQNFELLADQEVIPVDILKITKQYSGQIKRDESKYQASDYYYIFECKAELNLPALQWQQLVVKPLTGVATALDISNQTLIKNEHYTVEYTDGQLTLTDTLTKQSYPDFLHFEDGGDEGDTYDYSPAYQDQILLLDFKQAEVACQVGQTGQQMTLNGTWELPLDLQERADAVKSTGRVKYQLTITLQANQPISFHLNVDNQVKDHRLRAILSSTITAENSFADTSFGYIKRPVVDEHLHDWQALGWKEEPTAIFPMLHYVNIHDNQNSWTVMSKGIKEYEIVGDHHQQIALTLFRSVGYLGRPDLIRRPGVASGNQFTYIPTPDSQLQETLHLKFALDIATTFEPAKTMKDFMTYAISQPFYQVQKLNLFTNTLRYFVMHPTQQTVTTQPFFELTNDQLVFSSLTESQDGSGWLVRIYNPNKQACSGKNVLQLDQDYMISETDFVGRLHRTLGEVTKVSCETFAPGEIKTIKINKKE
ncbi:alpha-mannosidase [Lactiplantibacillus fabifermentans T30PCM01]|uniref:Alpha-mannosidase n=2 Tax=Lactiplantibacillus fabifermentans TaxID=483011 RepID=W6T4D7_9LACO|nr:alpha-mannosidase [Lactiplantibacillus fabifermentans T30PCM01]